MMVYTNDTTDLALKIIKQYHKSPDGSVKAKVLLFNKKNGIVYINRKNKKLPAIFFEWNKLEEIKCPII